MLGPENMTLIDNLRVRAMIRRNAQDRKSVQEGKPDRLADLLEEAANEIERLHCNTRNVNKIQVVRATAQLRHLYVNLISGCKDSAQAKRLADGLLSPTIERLERIVKE